MKKIKVAYAAGLLTNLVVGGVAEIYFSTIYNESLRHLFDLPALLYVAPGLILNHFGKLGLSFDGPNHSGVIWLSTFLYSVLTCVVIWAIMRKRENRSTAERLT